MHRWVDYNAAYEDLSAFEPAERLRVLLVEWGSAGLSLEIEELRKLFIYAWADGANPTGDDHHAMAMLEWISPVRDAEVYLAGTVTVYRPADGDEDAIRWTLDEAVAREESPNGIVRGQVQSGDVLAHLMAGGKNHVLVNPTAVAEIQSV